MSNLPPLRRKIKRGFFLIVALFATLGILLVIAVSLASRNTPKAIHRNYDSIAAFDRMEKAWGALRAPQEYPVKRANDWLLQFEDALKFAENNLTEPGEEALIVELRRLWDRTRSNVSEAGPGDTLRLRQILERLVTLNEQGMFDLAHETSRLNRIVLVGTVIYFLVTLVLGAILADSLSMRLAQPLKSIAEILRSRPPYTKKLRLPEPTSLEVLILGAELDHLWERLRKSEEMNFSELMRQKSKLEVVVESVEDAVLLIDGTGEVAHCNPCMLTLIGLPKDQVLGQFWKDLPTFNENYTKMRQALVDDVQEGTEIELLLENQSKQYSIRHRPISRQGWSHTGGLFLLRDVTDRKRRDQLRAEMIDLLSHELKTPLQSLGIASDLLAEKKSGLPEDTRLMVEIISEDVQRIRAVANEFVQVTQTHAKVMKLRLERVILNQYLPEWLKPFRVVAKDRNVKVDYVQEGSELVYANIDTVKFPWVISNLVSNAIRFSPADTTITVKLTDRDGAVEIKVMDQGAGISTGDQDVFSSLSFRPR